ncbi:dynamin family protein [soil metagenome]
MSTRSQPAAPSESKAASSPTQFARDVVKLGVDAATAYQRPDLQERIQIALDRLERPDTIVCITGEFKKGKSALVNGLVGDEYCPVDDDLATSAITILRYADEPSITVRRHEDDETVVEPIERDQIPDFVTEAGNPENSRNVEFVELQIRNGLLARGVTLVDTPGSGTLASGYGAATLAFLQSADALIFVTDCSQELIEPEIEYLQAATERCSTVLVAMTKIDLYPEWRRIVEINQGHLERAGIEATIVPVSTTLRQIALEGRDRDLNEESGYPALLETLRSEILDQAGTRAAREALKAVREATDQMIGAYKSELAILNDPDSGGDELARLEDAKERLNALRGAGSRWATVMNDGFAVLTSNVDYQFRSTMRGILRSTEDRIEEIDPAKEWDEITERLQEDVARAVEEAFNRIDDDVGQLRDTIAGMLRDETVAIWQTSAGAMALSMNVDEMWVEREIENENIGQKMFKGLNAMRGSYMGLLMVGMLGNFVGLAMLTPLLIGAGVLFGGRQFLEERKRDVTRKRQQARTFVRQFVDDVQFEAGTRIRETTRDFQREMRDYFTDRIGELAQTYTEAIQNTQSSLKQDESSRESRKRDLTTRVEKLGELRRRVEIAGERL